MCVVSSWKLDSSSTQTSGSMPASSASISASSADGEMLPQAIAGTPAPFNRWAVNAVVVVLPLLPVMAMIFEAGASSRTPAANRSISDTTGTSTAATCGVAFGTPGDSATRSTPAKAAAANGPAISSAAGATRASAATLGGLSRESATRTNAPCRCSHLAIASPDSPSPTTRTRLPLSSISATSGKTARPARA